MSQTFTSELHQILSILDNHLPDELRDEFELDISKIKSIGDDVVERYESGFSGQFSQNFDWSNEKPVEPIEQPVKMKKRKGIVRVDRRYKPEKPEKPKVPQCQSFALVGKSYKIDGYEFNYDKPEETLLNIFSSGDSEVSVKYRSNMEMIDFWRDTFTIQKNNTKLVLVWLVC